MTHCGTAEQNIKYKHTHRHTHTQERRANTKWRRWNNSFVASVSFSLHSDSNRWKQTSELMQTDQRQNTKRQNQKKEKEREPREKWLLGVRFVCLTDTPHPSTPTSADDELAASAARRSCCPCAASRSLENGNPCYTSARS